MVWSRSRKQHFAAGVEDVWQVVGDPRLLPDWNTAVAKVWLDAPPEVGVTGRLVPASRAAVVLQCVAKHPLRVIECQAPRRLVLEQRYPGGALRIEWQLDESGGGCDLVQRISVSGPSTTAIALALAGSLTDGWADACARLHGLLDVSPAPDRLRVVIAGGSGMLGRALAADLVCRGQEVMILTRRRKPEVPHRQVEWDARTIGPWANAVFADPARTTVVNLAGRRVDVRPTAAAVADLRDSRVDATKALVDASNKSTTPLAYWVQGSTTAIWSDAGEAGITESTELPHGDSALPQMTGVARPWEAAAAGARSDRFVILRTSIVLQPGAPAMNRLVRLTRAGLGGRVGSGRQWFSWIHLTDWLTVARAALGMDADVVVPDGVVIAAAPNPVRNSELMATLRRVLQRPPAPPTPAAMVRAGSVLLRADPALGLTGRHCTSAVLDKAGFDFTYPVIGLALGELFS